MNYGPDCEYYTTSSTSYPTVCSSLPGASTVTQPELEGAYGLGLECCRGGWTLDGCFYVMQGLQPWCGNPNVGLNSLSGGCNTWCKVDQGNTKRFISVLAMELQ